MDFHFKREGSFLLRPFFCVVRWYGMLVRFDFACHCALAAAYQADGGNLVAALGQFDSPWYLARVYNRCCVDFLGRHADAAFLHLLCGVRYQQLQVAAHPEHAAASYHAYNNTPRAALGMLARHGDA